MLIPSTKHLRMVGRAYIKQIKNSVQYGNQCPKPYQELWLNPKLVVQELRLPSAAAGQVNRGNWKKMATPLLENFKVRACFAHWIDGVSWEQTGVYTHVMQGIEKTGRPEEGCLTIDQIVNRYKNLDLIFEKVNQCQKLRSQKEMRPWNNRFRGYGNINIHIDEFGNPLFAGGGTHRLSIALILEIPLAPFCLRSIHADLLGKPQ